MASKRYEYTPLAWRRDIRLLRLHPASGPDDPELSVDLVPMFLDIAPSFCALSYAWGDPLPKREINCSGRRAEIGSNLFSALYHLRQHQAPDESPLIWADALCINQDDTAERESQVRMMGDIYAKASTTVIWLGDADDHVARAFDWLRRFSNIWESLKESFDIPDFIDLTKRRELEAIFAQSDNAEARDALRAVFGEEMSPAKAFEDIWALLRRPWFMRKWVIQEVVKSQNHSMVFIAGKRWMDWMDFHFWFEFLSLNLFTRDVFLFSCPWGHNVGAHEDTNPQSFFARGQILAHTFVSTEMPLSHLLAITAMFKCADPRDHIISLLGIAQDSSRFKDLIDYNTSTDDLYRRLTCAHLTTGLTLKILWSTHTIVPVDRRRRSSWIPNIEEMASRSALSDVLNLTSGWWKMANASRSTKVKAAASRNSLLIKGRIIDVVEQLGRDMTVFCELLPIRDLCFTAENKRVIGIWTDWHNECQMIAESAGQGERGLVDTMLIEDLMILRRADILATAKKDFLAYRRFLATLAAAPDEPTWLETKESMDIDLLRSMRVIESFHSNMLLRRFGRTRYGRIGWMPLVAEEGDHICVFDGMEFPYVIRQMRGSDGKYVLVGDCLIPSLMNGEAMELPGVESIIITLE